MWRKLFNGPWPDQSDLPASVQKRAIARVRRYWRNQVWQILLGEIVLWYVAQRDAERFPKLVLHPRAYSIPLILMTLTFILSLFPGMEVLWLAGMVIIFVFQAMTFRGLGTLTAVSLMLPYTFAALTLPGRRRVFVQACCVVGFWFCLIYVLFLPDVGLTPSPLLLVGYSVLIAAFTFQGLRFSNRLALELNTIHVAEEVTQRSQQFLARVSHELRTPLNSVLGFAKMLRRSSDHDQLSTVQSSYLNQIVEEGEQLNHLISDLLDSAQLATGKLHLKLESCDINQICGAVADEIKSILRPAVNLKVNLSPDLPPIAADNLRLRQIVRNLVGNAAKYTPHGEIAIKTFERNGSVMVAVSDTGPGIPEDKQALVFVPFVKLDGRSAGVGLGLDIALQLARLHRGDIQLHSVVGQGSTFTVDIPVERLDLGSTPI